ncbi:hypothetical protein M404DRAFT_27200 [Pisolithus tinctorius Marx 270]|uniref:Uncharacterized protein n=1 Tax=Pisolithus tinctorius Marx 270 TaxID=870435 RepID=A0A0C3P6K1_PISTI|nr:hypothetical protein M404DRAFT_27200 [Pisolithus tinctorius Marx 270]
MSIHWSRTPYDQDLLPDLTQATSAELQVGSDNDDEAIWGKLAEHKRRKARVQEEAQLEAERQEQAWLEEERACTEAEVQRLEAPCKAEEARKEAESQWADALVGSLTGASSNIKVMNPCCLRCAWTNTTCVRSTDSKKKRMACNWCNELKECCQWPVEGEAGVGPAGDKGKRKANMTSPHTGEKKKRLRQPSAKVLEGASDEDEDVGKGPSTKKVGKETGASPVTGDQMEHLIKVVEHVADNVVEEHFKFLAPDIPSDQDTTNEEDRDIEGLDNELEGLREEEEESRSWSESGDQASASSGSQV